MQARLDKEERRVALERFAEGKVRYLVTSDLGARGLDIAGLSHVVSLDLPEEGTVYIHRAGRTGRAGRDGQAIAFCSEEERPLLKDILKLTGLELDPDSGELAPAQNSRKKPAGKKPDTAQTGGQKQAEEKRAAQKQPAQSQAGQRPGRRKPQGQAPGDPKPQGQRTGGKQTPDGQQPQDKDAAARPARRRNRNRGRQKPDRQNAAAANTERRQDDRKSGSQKPARDKRETGSPEAPRKTQAPEKKKSGMGSWLSGILRPGRK
jgi:ATP-dependent RNA helicase RhlE